MTSASPAPRGVYLITPDEPDTARLLARTAPLAAGATWLQYRNKTASGALQREQAMQALCAEYGVPLIVNDDPALAKAVGAAGCIWAAPTGHPQRARPARPRGHHRRLLL